MAMKELITKIQESYQAFVKDANLQVENGNKAAGVRARKASLEIEKMMRNFAEYLSKTRRNNRDRPYGIPYLPYCIDQYE